MVKINNIKSNRIQIIVQLVLVVGLVIVLNFLGNYIHGRIDFTQDKRFTLSSKTIEMLENLEQPVFITVYLDGDLPPGFKRLKESTRDVLMDFKYYSNGKISFEFVDPYAIASGNEVQDLFNQLKTRGLKSFELEDLRKDEIVHKIIWPCALITSGEKELPVNFLIDQIGQDPEVVLHNSMVNLEYEIAISINRLSKSTKPSIAFLGGNGELSAAQTADLASELTPYYDIQRLDIRKYKPGKLEQFDAVIIAKPDSAFSDVDLYKLDQYIMNGGKVLWMFETLVATLDSLAGKSATTTMEYNLNVKDLLFKYGIRLNYDLVQDYNCHVLPIYAGEGNTNSQFRPWPYYPLVAPKTNHPLVRNIGLVWFQFASPIDTTVSAEGISNTVLLSSSANSRLMHHPHRISLQTLKFDLNPAMFNKGSQALAVLYEGKFNSYFKNKIAPETLNNPDFKGFVEQSAPNKMIVISDGDIAANEVSKTTGAIRPLGFDKFTGVTFNNKAFVLNCIDYLVDESGFYTLRSKEYKLRLLDKGKLKESKSFWQYVNLLAPLVLLILFGVFYQAQRKLKYTRK